MGPRVLFTLLFLTAAAVAQPPKITSFVNSATLDTNFGPGSGLVILGTFTPHSAGRDYTITVGGQTTGINVAADGVFILATVPPTAPAGAQTLVITYLGQSSNALPINLAALAPEFGGTSVTISGAQTPPQYSIYRPFSHAANGQYVTPLSQAARGEILSANISGIGADIPPAVTPTVTVAGETADVVQTNGAAGYVTIYFAVPNDAPLGIDPVVATLAGVTSNTASLPVGSAPAIGGILNGASFGSAGVVAPGSIVSVFGAGFGSPDNLAAFPSTSPNGVSILFGNTPAPVFALVGSVGQINVLVPMESQNGQTSVTVQDSGGASLPFSATVVPAAPGMFFYTDPLVPSRHNAVAATANTAWFAMPLSMAANMGLPTNCSALSAANVCAQPAHPGDYLQLYVTGLGRATVNGDPNGALLPTGSVAPVSGSPLYLTVLTPSVTIGGQPATVLFSGLGPGYSGLYQVDVQIPANTPVGDDVPIQIVCGGIADSATIALAKK
jgi:uncharacterized protein (TIGR03437 family)